MQRVGSRWDMWWGGAIGDDPNYVSMKHDLMRQFYEVVEIGHGLSKDR